MKLENKKQKKEEAFLLIVLLLIGLGMWFWSLQEKVENGENNISVGTLNSYFQVCQTTQINCSWTVSYNLFPKWCADSRLINKCEENNGTWCLSNGIEIKKENYTYQKVNCRNIE